MTIFSRLARAALTASAPEGTHPVRSLALAHRAQADLDKSRRAMLAAPVTPQSALASGCTREATAWAIATSFCRRYGVSAARQLIDVMGRAVSAYERETRDLPEDARRAGL